MKFNDMPYQRPDMKDVKSHFEKVKNDILNATSAKQLAQVILDYENNFSKDLNTTISLSHVRYTINTLDEFYEKENEFWDENSPIIENLTVEVAKAINSSKFKEDLKKEFGEHYFKLLECSLVLNEKAIPYMQKENELVTKYSKIIANSKIEFRGKTYTLSQFTPLLQNIDREFRKEAFAARTNFLKIIKMILIVYMTI